MRTFNLLALPFALFLAACGGSGSSGGSGGSGGSDSSTSSASSSSSGAGGAACTPDVTLQVDDTFNKNGLNSDLWSLLAPIGLFSYGGGEVTADQLDLSLGIQGTLQAGPMDIAYNFTTPLDAEITFACTDKVQYCRFDVPLFDVNGTGKGPDISVEVAHDQPGNQTYAAFKMLDSNGSQAVEQGLTFNWLEASVIKIVFDPISGALTATLTDGAGMDHVLQGNYPVKQYAFAVQFQGNASEEGATVSRLDDITTNLEMIKKGDCMP